MQECSITDNSRATAAQGTETTRLKAIIDQLEAEKTSLKADIQFSKRQLKISKEDIKSLDIEHNDEVVELKRQLKVASQARDGAINKHKQVKHAADATVKKADSQMKDLLKEQKAETDAAAKKLQQVQDTAAKKLEEVQHAAAKEFQLVQDDLVKAKAGLNDSNAKLDEKIS
jgi:hypothetical protein